MGAYAALQRLAGLGFHCIEISQIPMTLENVAAMQRASGDFGIKVAACSAALESMGAGRGDALETDIGKIVADCKLLNCSLLRVGMLPTSCMGSLEKTLDFAARMEAVAARLEEHGIGLYFHNHHVEFEKYGGRYLLDIIKDSTSRIGFELDVHWIQRGGENPVTIIRRYTGRIRLIHLKDYRIRYDLARADQAFNEAVQFAEVGEGNLPMKEIIDTALEGGSQYFLIEQDDTYGRDVFDCLVTSRDNLIKMGYQEWFQPG
jgi:sugar phosphate isomerase/epimerase